MEEQQRSRKDTIFAVVVIIAGLISGAILTYMFLQPEEKPQYTPEYRAAEGQRFPMEASAQAHEEEGAASEEATDAPPDPEGTRAGSSEDEPSLSAEADDDEGETQQPDPDQRTGAEDQAPAPPDDEAPADPEESSSEPDDSTAADRETIERARKRMREQGVEEYRELTEELYIRVSARMVIMASVLSQDVGEDVDPTDFQHLMADHAAEVLAKENVDPQDFWAYTRDVHSDPERAKEMGQKILREAEKHTQREITVESVPGMTPTPVPNSDGG